MQPSNWFDRLRSRKFQWLILGGLVVVIAVMVVVSGWHQLDRLSQTLGDLSLAMGERYNHWLEHHRDDHPLLLPLFAFAGGLVASISPCILSLLPVNLSYIGTQAVTSRRDAIAKATAFVLGVVTVLSLLGLFSALAAIVFIKFRGFIQIAVGLLIILMGGHLIGLIQVPLPKLPIHAPRMANSSSSVDKGDHGLTHTLTQLSGPYTVGLTFALISSPCTSPVMFSVLAAGAATGSQVQSTLVMVAYALGYTAIIFMASVFTGLAKRTRFLLHHATAITRFASGILVLVGGFYLVDGSRWVLAWWSRLG